MSTTNSKDGWRNVGEAVATLSTDPEIRESQLAEIHRQTTLKSLDSYRRPKCPERPYELLRAGTDSELAERIRIARRKERPSHDDGAILAAFGRWVGGVVDDRGRHVGGVYGAEDQGASNVLHLLRVASHLSKAGDEDEAYKLILWIEKQYECRIPGVIHDDLERRRVAQRAALRFDVLPWNLRHRSPAALTAAQKKEPPCQINLGSVFVELS